MMKVKRGQPVLLGIRNRPFHVVSALAFFGLLASLAHMRGSTGARDHSYEQQVQRSLLSALSSSSAKDGGNGSHSSAVADLISAPAAVHGWVKKTGRPVALLHWHDELFKQRQEHFQRWFGVWSNRGEGTALAPGRGGEALPHVIMPPCQIFVNHAYKFLYVRLPKTGSTSLVKYFTECEFSHPGPACMQRLPGDTPVQEVERLFATYFVFTVVRNPYQRALSSYKYVISKMRAEPESCTAGLNWDLCVGNPMAPGGRCRADAGCCTQSAGFFWHHVSRQSRCLLDEEGDAAWGAAMGVGVVAGGANSSSGGGRGNMAGGGGDGGSNSQAAAAAGLIPGGEPRWAVDYIARTEHMAEDLLEILTEIDRRRDPSANLPVLAPALAAQEGGGQGDGGREGGSGGWGGEQVAGGAAASFPRQLKKRNSVVVCAEGGKRLAPQRMRAQGGTYLAAVIQEQYCREEEYFVGQHAGALAAVGELYRQDLALLYPASARAAASS